MTKPADDLELEASRSSYTRSGNICRWARTLRKQKDQVSHLDSSHQSHKDKMTGQIVCLKKILGL